MAEAEAPALRGHHADSGVAARLPQDGEVVSCRRPQSRLHNFSFPSMSWGTHRLLRCIKVDPGAASPSVSDSVSASESGPLGRRVTGASAPPRAEEVVEAGEEGKDERMRGFQDAVVLELQKAADRIPLPQTMMGPQSKGSFGAPSPPPAAEAASKPWNLRMRRAAAYTAPSAARERVVPSKGQSLAATEKGSASAKCSGRIRRREPGPEKEERPRFSSVLSKAEIEEDFLLMTGSKPPRPPLKRHKNIRKPIEMLCPGFFLTEITPDLYKTSQGH